MATAGSTRGERVAEVLDPSFLEGLADLPTEEIRARRDRAMREREFHSYLRRLIQARQDVLVDERRRRERGEESGPLVERLTEALSSGPQGRSRGEAVRIQLPEDDIAEAERRVAVVVGGVDVADPGAIGDAPLAELLDRLHEEERSVSRTRSAVLRVLDELQEELKRRYRQDPSQIPQGI